MSRTVLPKDFAGQQALQVAINKKHLADKTTSVLIGYFADHDIVFTDDQTAAVAAKGYEASRLIDLGLSETATKDRNKAFAAPWGRTLQWAQFLKGHYAPNPKELVAWGLPALDGGEIKYPSGFAARATITSAIIAKHLAFPLDTSPLQPFILANEDDVTLLAGEVTTANAKEVIRVEKRKSSQYLINKRKKKWAVPNTNLKGIGAFLKTLYPDDTVTMGLYGFEEVDTPLPTSERVVSLLPLKDKKISGVELGSVLENTGEHPFEIYAGTKKVGTGIPIAVGEKFGMNKGFSSIVAYNPNLIGTVKFTVVVY